MTLYIGVDFHPHQQTVSYCNNEEGEVHQTSLVHNVEQVRRFYRQLPKAVVGIEASCTAAWFEQLLSELGHELKVGNPSAIRARARSRHKSDKRDADLILELLVKDEFPELWRRPLPSQSVLEQRAFPASSGQTSHADLQSPAGFGARRWAAEKRQSNKACPRRFNGSQFHRNAELRARSDVRVAR